MKFSLSLVILVTKCIYGFQSTSYSYLDDGKPWVDQPANQNRAALGDEAQDRSKEWPEQLLATDADENENVQHQQEEPSDHTENEDKGEEDRDVGDVGEVNKQQQLISFDYTQLSTAEYFDGKTYLQKAEIKLDPKEQKQYQKEIAAGDPTQLFATNPHHYQPSSYPDFGRRFVPQYPYTYAKELKDAQDYSLTPKLAKPELVLTVAKESAILAAATPENPTEDVIRKDILRSGQFWNSVWKEDVDPKQLLRSIKRNKMESVNAKLTPGTEIYNVVSKMQQLDPKLLYVINKNNRH